MIVLNKTFFRRRKTNKARKKALLEQAKEGKMLCVMRHAFRRQPLTFHFYMFLQVTLCYFFWSTRQNQIKEFTVFRLL